MFSVDATNVPVGETFAENMPSSQVSTPKLTVLGLLTLIVLFSGAYVQYQPRVMITKPSNMSLYLAPPRANTTCPKIALSRTTLPLTALASFPGSGNTWTRHLIQQMTGIATGAVYRDKALLRNGFPGEGLTSGEVIVIKTHLPDISKFNRCVIIVRNPYESFLSEFNRFESGSHKGVVQVDKFCKAWIESVKKSCDRYISLHTSWSKHHHIHLVLYESLKGHLQHELENLLKFLKNSTNITGNVQCALQHSTGNFKRNHTKSISYEFFYSSRERKKVNDAISRVSKMFKDRFPTEAKHMEKWKI